MPLPLHETPGASPLTLALGAASAFVALLAMIGKYIGYVVKRKDDSFEKVRADAEKVENDRRALRTQDDHDARDEAKRLLEERKIQVAEFRAENVALRAEFGAETADLRKAIKEQGEEVKLVNLSALAAHIRADEAIQQLDLAKRERDEIAQKLSVVEERANKAELHGDRIEKEKNLEIEVLGQQLARANRKIEELERYIREHKMSVTLHHGQEVITASMDPLKEMQPPTEEGDFSF